MPSPAPAHDLPTRTLLALLGAAAAFLVVYFTLVLPRLGAAWRMPGSPPLYLLGVAGAALLLLSAGYSVAKRGGRAQAPVTWFRLHVLAGTLGAVLVWVHGAGHLARPPALLLLVVLALVGLGLWARARGARHMADTIGTKRGGFAGPCADLRERLRAVIARKAALLRELDPAASEATFSVTLRHWCSKPLRSLAYVRLVREEERLIGARASVGRAQAWWRPLHMSLALAFVAGLLAHVVVVTLFAGYTAGGREIYWWHLRAW
jgi:hypothetical protein